MEWPHAAHELLGHLGGPSAGVWHSAAARILAIRASANSADLEVDVAHLQGSPEPRQTELDLVNARPDVLQGYLSAADLKALIESWKAGQPCRVGPWRLRPPEIESAHWAADMLPRDIAPRLETWVPEGQVSRDASVYRLHRLTASGKRTRDVFNTVHEAALKQGVHTDEWTHNYLGLPRFPDFAYIELQLPIPVLLDATFDQGARLLTAIVYYHRPLGASDFWIRVGRDWNIRQVTLRLSEEDEIGDGWARGSVTTQLPATDGPTRVWAGWSARPDEAQWYFQRALGQQITTDSLRRMFLVPFYRLSRERLSDHIVNAAAGARGGSGVSRLQDKFEVGISNAFAALGHATFFGGAVLQTQGVDIVAFDAARGVAYLISVTVSNDIADKLPTLLVAIEDVTAAIGAAWSVQPVIITALPQRCVVVTDRETAAAHHTTILTLDELCVLGEDPPNLGTFERLLSARSGP